MMKAIRPNQHGRIQELRKTIKYLHKVESTHVESIYVREIFQKRAVWEGIVEVFDLHRHLRTGRAYVLRHNSGQKSERQVALLHIEPVVSPQAAVRAAIETDFRNDAN